MLFNSFIFFVFGSLFFLLFYFIKRSGSRELRWGFLVAASFFFYGWWDWRFLFLILTSGFIDYFGARGIYRYQKQKKLFLILSILGNVGSLAVFKYSGFIAENIDMVLGLAGVKSNLAGDIPEFMLLLPVGISFYTFQSMSYTIDVYRGQMKPTTNVLHFFAYLSLFPQLVAGPIVRATDLLPQLRELRPTSEIERWNGFKLIIIGFFKKVVLADNIAPLVNSGFANIHMTDNGPFWWIVIIGFAFQIYFDFSGYSDIARGLAKWMGLHFRLNFNHPYHSRSLREFWGRWHISLSTWFRDFVYIPLGGSRKGRWNAHVFMWITMVVSGLWHGAAWTFIIWGGLHAFYLSVERVTRWPQALKDLPAGGLVSILITNVLVLVGWVFFRADSVGDAAVILTHMFSWGGEGGFVINDEIRNGLVWLTVSMAIELITFFRIKPHLFVPVKFRRFVDVIYVLLMMLACIYLRGEGNVFIYFQF
ncbi:MAG: MBOAT family protein [Bacteroidales bacterium]|nr:MBOAT family protein [Bacteroidales bacterium]